MRLLSIIILLLSSLSAFSQSISTEFSFGASYAYADVLHLSSTLETREITAINDTTRLYTYGTRTNEYESKLDSSFSFHFQFDFRKALSKRLALKLGLGNRLFRFRQDSDFLSYSFVPNGLIDTIVYTPFVYDYSCDSTVTEYFELDISESGPISSIYYFILPINLEYELIENSLWIGAGAVLRTPLHFAKRNEYISFEREEINGLTVCDYLVIQNEDKSGSGFNHFLVDLNVQASVKIIRNLALDVSLQRPFISPFAIINNIELDKHYDHKPVATTLALRYKFNKRETEQSKE